MAKKAYDWRITAKKGGLMLAYVLVVGTISVLTNNAMYLGLLPVLKMAENYLKHKVLKK